VLLLLLAVFGQLVCSMTVGQGCCRSIIMALM
jgi:hypothetical protein